MFGRSQSGPGGLSINTNQANSLSAPSTSQPPASGSLFGSLQKDKSSTNLFGSSLSISQPQQSTSLFGSANTQAALGSTSDTGGGLFGATNMGQQQSSQPATTNSFGNTGTQSQNQQGGGLFGSLGPNQNQQKPQTSSLFGELNKPKENQSLWGSSTQAQNSNQQQSQQPSMLATSIGQYTQQQKTVPGVRVNVSELRPTTRFTDLHEQLQSVIENIDVFIQQQMKFQQECAALNPSIDEQCSQIPGDVEICTKALDTMQHALENDAGAISQAKTLTKGDVANAKLSFTALENMAVPQHYQATNVWALPLASRDAGPSLLADEESKDGEGSASLVSFFLTQAGVMSESLDNYNKNIIEVEAYLKGIEVNAIQQIQRLSFTQNHHSQRKSAEDQIRELAAVFKEFENGIINVAGKVGGVREIVQEVVLDQPRIALGKSGQFAPL
ncbi:MAG: hypothetical protein Q9218_004808 [Villophora microphyllina]